MTALVVVTEDDAFAAAIRALAGADLSVTCVHVEEAIASARHDRPGIVVIDTDSIRDSQSLIGALSLLTQARIVAMAHQAWPTSRAASEWRMAGADAVLPKPSGRASPTLAGLDQDDYRSWFIALAERSANDVAREAAS
jgi:ActR/RegA family two-component response regulator